MRVKYGLLLASALMLGSALAKPERATITRVSDGDTLWARFDGQSKPRKLRIYGIDAPEICQPGGQAARDALRARLLRQRVLIDTVSTDEHGRLIVRISHNGQDVAAWLVSQGQAWSDRHRNSPGPYAAEQQAAEQKRIGIWSAAERSRTIEPRQWRKRHGPCNA